MAAVLPRGDFFANPIVNPPYGAPRLHWELDAAGRPTMRILEGRRPGATPLVDRVRAEVARWRERGEAAMQQLTPVSARLLRHWKDHDFSGARPFWCQIEAAETAIWLREAASHDKRGRALLAEIAAAGDAGGGLSRLAFKMATGAGKTTVMAMLIAWQTLNAVRNPADKRFARGFLVVTPGLTIRERLRVLQPHDPDSWYASRELLPPDMLADLGKAKIVIVNFHAFLPRERLAVSRGGRSLLEGRTGPALDLRESEGRMMRRVMPELAGLDRVVVLNDEGHHCYRVRASAEALFAPEDAGSGARVETESARMWISGLEAVARHFEVVRVFDLSATPYYPQGSGYREGSLFPWTVADFPLLEAIECGIVKLPRVPKDCAGILVQPAAGRRRREPAVSGALASALMTLYRLYEQTFLLWEEVGMPAPPCFIVVCNDTVTSKLVYDYISAPGSPLELFRNFAAGGVPVDRPCTLLVDSRQLEADEDRSQQIRAIANSVGKPGKPGAGVRCVVSVAMLSEGWDASTVTHVLGVRAFGTQWLCEQVVGRALRRQSYEVDARGMLAPEFADVAGIPFDFAAEPVVAAPQRPRRAVSVHAVRPDRDALEIRFPRVEGYQLELPAERLRARFGPECGLVLTPEMAASPAGSRGLRTAAVASHLARELIVRDWRDTGGFAKWHLFGQMGRLVGEWLEHWLDCRAGAEPALLLEPPLLDLACDRIGRALSVAPEGERAIVASLDPHGAAGSTACVRFESAAAERWPTDPARCHVNWVILESQDDAEFCRRAERHPQVLAYCQNRNLGFEVPYLCGGLALRYRPGYIVVWNDGRGWDDPLMLAVEVSGYAGKDAEAKKAATEQRWVPGVNRLKRYGRWAFSDAGIAVVA